MPEFGRLGDVAGKLGQNAEQEGGGFSGSGLRVAGHIFGGEGERQNLGLNRCAVFKAQVGDGVQDFVGKIHVLEAGFSLFGFYLKGGGIPRFGRFFWRTRLVFLLRALALRFSALAALFGLSGLLLWCAAFLTGGLLFRLVALLRRGLFGLRRLVGFLLFEQFSDFFYE